MAVDFEDVMKVRRLEKGASRLVRVDADFYDQLASFVSEEMSVAGKTFSLVKAKELENLKTAVVDIYNMREKKILAQALTASRTGTFDVEHMTASEKELFDSIVELLTRSRGCVIAPFSEGGSDSAGDDFNKVSLTFLSEVPAFVGDDLREYGPFVEGASAELPGSVANLLLSRGLAQKASV